MDIGEKWRQIPGPVKQFLLKAVALFAAWKIVYLLILLPNRTLDKPLTHAIAAGTTGMLNGLSHSASYFTREGIDIGTTRDGEVIREDLMDIYLGRDKVLSIADVCNGLELMVLYAGLIICLPASWQRKTLFILAGVLLTEVLNVFRCAGLALLYLHRPEYLDFSHHYLFSFLVYGFIFWLWYLFSRDSGFAKNLKLNASIQ